MEGKVFPVFTPVDLAGNNATRPGDEERHREGWDGVNLIPFQCEVCHVWNIKSWSPIEGLPEDKTLRVYIQRAKLDAFWSREPSTVSGHLREAQIMERKAAKVGLRSFSDPMRPSPLKDSVGMRAAVAVLQKSVNPGVYTATVQFAATRRAGSTVTVLHE
jgi:hypothetical protein